MEIVRGLTNSSIRFNNDSLTVIEGDFGAVFNPRPSIKAYKVYIKPKHSLFSSRYNLTRVAELFGE